MMRINSTGYKDFCTRICIKRSICANAIDDHYLQFCTKNMFCALTIDSTISVVDPELFIADLDPTF
jgi:hypothetical protein